MTNSLEFFKRNIPIVCLSLFEFTFREHSYYTKHCHERIIYTDLFTPQMQVL